MTPRNLHVGGGGGEGDYLRNFRSNGRIGEVTTLIRSQLLNTVFFL